MIPEKTQNTNAIWLYLKPQNSVKELALLLSMFVALMIGGIGLLGLEQLRVYSTELPTKEKIIAKLSNKGENSKIYDRRGTLLYTFKDPIRDREYAEYSEIPPVVIAAVLAAEDKDFFIHEGIDYIATINGILTTVFSDGENILGGSTITQQLVKQTLLTSEKTVDRKIKEAILAIQLEQLYTKEHILELYLNTTPYGGRIQGIKTAARAYFNKSLEKLTLNEAVFLVGLIQSPGEYSPLYSDDPKRATQLGNERRQLILEAIATNPVLVRYLNSADLQDLYKRNERPNGHSSVDVYLASNVRALSTTQFKFKQPKDRILAPHWVFYVRQLLQQKPYNLSLEDLYSGGYQIYTSIDYRIQRLAEEHVRWGAETYGPRGGFANAAIVTVDPRDGSILAMAGSKGYFLSSSGDGRFDPKVNVVTSRQSLGSSLKPWVAYLAFDSGRFSKFSVVEDVATTFFGRYTPKNWDGRFIGTTTVYHALQVSRNLPFLRILYELGDRKLEQFMRSIGYRTSGTDYGLAAAIGGVDESLLDHTTAYSGMASGGRVVAERPVLKILDSSGQEIFKSKTKVLANLNPKAVADVNSILGDKSYSFGYYGYKFYGNQKMAGKTGTSDGNRDTFYVGYGPKFVTGLWCGNSNNVPMSDNSFGVNTSLPIWGTYTRALLDRFPEYGTLGSY